MIRLFKAATAAFVLLGLWLGYWQVLRAPDLERHPRNPRPAIAAASYGRGTIRARGGEPLALTERVGQGAGGSRVGQPPVRKYVGPLGLAATVGYVNARLGTSGLERAFDKTLAGQQTLLARLFGPLWASEAGGQDVFTTISLPVQQAAEEALGGRVGAVVALNPKDGDILALATYPSFHPERVAADWESLRNDAESPLLNRPLQGLYPPGSTMKVVVLAAGLDSGRLRVDQSVLDDGAMTVGDITIRNFDETAHGWINPVQALVISSNVGYVRLGLEVGSQTLSQYARRLGIGRSLPLPIPTSAGTVPPLPTEADVAQLSIGQGALTVSPLEMALVAATVANGGVLPTPRLHRPPGGWFSRLDPTHGVTERGERVLKPWVAQQVAEAMALVVEGGTGTAAKIPGVRVAGKTGTAENPRGSPHAWFIGFAPVDNPVVAVAVIVENSGTGGRTAAPIAKAVMAAAIANAGQEAAWEGGDQVDW